MFSEHARLNTAIARAIARTVSKYDRTKIREGPSTFQKLPPLFPPRKSVRFESEQTRHADRRCYEWATTLEIVRSVPPDRLLRYETQTSKSPLLKKKLSTSTFGKSFRILPHPLVYLKSALRVPPRTSSRGPAPRIQVT